jgi:N4-gp56 family major capsid protein
MITDLTDLTSTDPIITEVMMILGEQMAYTRDKILAGVLVGTSSVFYAGGVATRSAIVTLPKPADFNKIKRAFDRAHAKPFTSAIYGSAKVSSQAIRPAFMAVVHPDTLFCLENPSDSDWAGKFVSFANYPQESQWDPAEVGSYGYFRFLLSDMAPIVPDSGGAASTTFKFTTSASALDVYQTLIFAKDAFSVCPMDKGTFEPIIVPPGGQADPLKRRTLVGWKLTTANIITNDLFMCNYEHAVSV